MKVKIEALEMSEGNEFELNKGDQILSSELIDRSGHWGLVILRDVTDYDSE